MMHILITRPQENVFSLKNQIQALGHRVTIDPLIRITPLASEQAPKLLPGSFSAIVTTSQHAIRCLSNLTPERDFPLWCVGVESAKIAKNLGFENIHTAHGSAEDLIDKLLTTFIPPLDKPLLHLSGDIIRVDVAKALKNQGLSANRVVIYTTEEAKTLSQETQIALKTGSLDAILFYSPRTAQIFRTLCQKTNLEDHCRAVTAICLSDSIRTAIADLPWKNVRIAKKTTTDDLLIALMMAD